MQIVALNMVPSGVNPIAYASQYDTARAVRFPLLNGAPDDQYSLSGYETLSVKLTKPDGSEVTFNVPNPGAGKTYVDVMFPYEACNQAGVCLGELRMESPGIWDFGSLNFILKVEADAYGDDVEVKAASGSIATFETALSDNVVELTAEINPLQSGSGTPSPSNPRPISGFTECNIADCGVNLFDVTLTSQTFNDVVFTVNSDKTITANGTANGNIFLQIGTIHVIAGQTYTLKGCPSGGGSGVYSLYASLTDGNKNDYGSGITFTATVTEDAPVRIAVYNTKTINGTYKPQIELGSSSSPYEPYHGNLVTVAFGQTVYGGVLTCKNGAWKVVITKGVTDLTDTEQSTIGGQTVFIKSISNAKLPSSDSSIAEIVAEAYEPIRFYGIAGTPNTIALSTASLLAVNTGGATPPVGKCMFTLATPIEIDLTAEQVETLVGQNNVFHDANGEIEVKYLDIKG